MLGDAAGDGLEWKELVAEGEGVRMEWTPLLQQRLQTEGVSLQGCVGWGGGEHGIDSSGACWFLPWILKYAGMNAPLNSGYIGNCCFDNP